MKKRITFGISFPEEKILELGKKRANELGIRSFSEYINQLVRLDLGLPNYIEAYTGENRKERAEALISKLSPNNHDGNGK